MPENILAIYGVEAEVTEVVTSQSGQVLFAETYWNARTLDTEDIIPGNLVKVIGRNDSILVVTQEYESAQTVDHPSKEILNEPIDQAIGLFSLQPKQPDEVDFFNDPSDEPTLSFRGISLFENDQAFDESKLGTVDPTLKQEPEQEIDGLLYQIDAAFDRMDQKRERINTMREEINHLLDEVDMDVERFRHNDKQKAHSSQSLDARLANIDAIVEEICGISF